MLQVRVSSRNCTAANWLAQSVACQTVVYRVKSSRAPDRTNTQDLKITGENMIPFFAVTSANG